MFSNYDSRGNTEFSFHWSFREFEFIATVLLDSDEDGCLDECTCKLRVLRRGELYFEKEGRAVYTAHSSDSDEEGAFSRPRFH
jgi:hypothetical protein